MHLHKGPAAQVVRLVSKYQLLHSPANPHCLLSSTIMDRIWDEIHIKKESVNFLFPNTGLNFFSLILAWCVGYMLKCLFFLAKLCSTILDPHFKKGFGVHLRWYKAQIGQPKRIQSKKYCNNFLYCTNLSKLTMMPLGVMIDWWNQPSRWKFGFTRRIIAKPVLRERSLFFINVVASARLQFSLVLSGKQWGWSVLIFSGTLFFMFWHFWKNSGIYFSFSHRYPLGTLLGYNWVPDSWFSKMDRLAPDR